MPPTLPGGDDIPTDSRESDGAHNLLPEAQLHWPDPDEEEDDFNMYGYEMLSPNEEDFRESDNSDEQSEEENEQPSFSQPSTNEVLVTHTLPSPTDILHSRLHLEPDDIEKIITIMRNVTLPSSNVPPWASSISEDQWKSFLENKIVDTSKDQKLTVVNENEHSSSLESKENN